MARCLSGTARWLVAGADQGGRRFSAPAGVVPDGRGDRLYRVPAASLAGPGPPDEIDRVCRSAVGAVDLPDHFAAEGWGVEQLIAVPVVFAIGFVSLFFARTVLVWLYNRTGSSVLLVAIFHASFDASISQLSYDVVPGSNTARFLIFTGVVVAPATAAIIATKGQLGRRTVDASR